MINELFSLLGGFVGGAMMVTLLFTLLFIFAWIIASYLLTTFAIIKILKTADLYEKYEIQAWIPCWQFVCIADLLEDFDESISSFGEIARVLAVAQYVMILVHIPFISGFLSLGYWLFCIYLICRLSDIIYGKTNILGIVASIFGFSFIVYHIYGKDFEKNKYDIMNKRNHVDFSDKKDYNKKHESSSQLVKKQTKNENIKSTKPVEKEVNWEEDWKEAEVVENNMEDSVEEKPIQSNEEFLDEAFSGLGFKEEETNDLNENN